MTAPAENAFAALGRSFHEPNRLQILASLASAPQGVTFTDLKKQCGLTDGNLSRHLKMLQDAGVVAVEKAFVNAKPRSTVTLTERGRVDFLNYLDALENVLRQAKSVSAGPPPTPEGPNK